MYICNRAYFIQFMMTRIIPGNQDLKKTNISNKLKFLIFFKLPGMLK